jgi:hypothetical protein
MTTLRTLLLVLAAATAGPVSADVFMFMTPTGNINCSVGESFDSVDIQCDIVETTSPPPRPRPAGCTGSWGQSFVMLQRGPVQITCGPYPRRLDGLEIAPYGVVGDFGEIICLSLETGFECRNIDGHGFFLSRREVRVF